MTVLDFVNEKCQAYPDLQDFLGINISQDKMIPEDAELNA